jgi:CDP-diacylglycerol--glycerol-3-phosphate 3-phosphatidyltransferase
VNTPTKLTFLRIILTLAVIALLLFPFHAVGIHFKQFDIDGVNGPIRLEVLIAGVIFIIASLTDFLDGYLARKNNQVTNLGKMLDAIADKILVNSSLIILAVFGFVPTIVAVIIVMRDTCVDAIKMQAASKGDVVAAIWAGKFKTASLMCGLVLAFFYNLPFSLFTGLHISDFLLYFACIMAIVSAIQYFNMNKKYILKK